MGKKIFILLVVALVGMLILPALASATLVNEYGMHYAGQAECLRLSRDDAGRLKVTPALHGKFATTGVKPSRPADVDAVPAPPVTRRRSRVPASAVWTPGGSYSSASLGHSW